MKKRIMISAALLLLPLTAAGCSSSLASNVGIYRTQMSQKQEIWKESSTAAASAGESTAGADTQAVQTDDARQALSAPASFQVAEDGTYSFDGVDGAGYYIVYLKDKNSEDDSFAYMSSNIDDDGSASFTGKLSDLFSYSYGMYDAEVVAYPEIGAKDVKKSDPAECDFTVTGEVDDPQVGYLWDCFAGTLGIELINVEDYGTTAFPKTMKVSFVNTADSSDVVELDLENISVADDVFYASTSDVTKDAQYQGTAELTWDDSLVSNPTAQVDLGVVSTASDRNAMTDGYGYLNSSIYLSADYPMVETDFNPEEGGSAGTWYFYINTFVTSKGVTIPSTFRDCLNFQGEKGAMGSDYHGGENLSYTVTPKDTTEGSSYSYSLEVSGPRGVISLFDGFFYNDMPAASGSLELYPDGTLLMTIDPPEDDGSSPMGPRGLAGSSIKGLWRDNGDGTLTLSYDHSSVEGGGTGR